MTRFMVSLVCVLGVAGCGVLPVFDKREPADAADAPSEVSEPDEVVATAPPPPQTARTAEQFDTTTQAERAAAVVEASATGGARNLGTTIASLGAVAEPGIWMKTPLVSAPAKGRVDYPAKGTSVVVDLIPLEGDAGAGSQLSLAAMRLLEADLTGLPEVQVFRTGG